MTIMAQKCYLMPLRVVILEISPKKKVFSKLPLKNGG